MRIKVVVVGVGNIGRAVITGLTKQPDMDLVAVLTRRPDEVRRQLADLPVFGWDQRESLPTKPDVAVLCGGSRKDLFDGLQGAEMLKLCHTVDSFDTHARIPTYAQVMDLTARTTGHVAVISTGWDPGTFSLARVYGSAFLAGAKSYAFYGITPRGGLSMGHSDAIRTLPGVQDARQLTHANPKAMEQVRTGKNPDLKPGDMHWRECFVVLKPGADPEEVRTQIVTMPHYFEPYATKVQFVSQEELDRDHSGMQHDGVVITVGETAPGHRAVIEYRNVWDSNPEGTAGIMLAFARAAHRLGSLNNSGVFTPLDIPPAFLSPHTKEKLLKNFM
jgi:diaminopimelate dehydrogenase